MEQLNDQETEKLNDNTSVQSEEHSSNNFVSDSKRRIVQKQSVRDELKLIQDGQLVYKLLTVVLGKRTNENKRLTKLTVRSILKKHKKQSYLPYDKLFLNALKNNLQV